MWVWFSAVVCDNLGVLTRQSVPEGQASIRASQDSRGCLISLMGSLARLVGIGKVR